MDEIRNIRKHSCDHVPAKVNEDTCCIAATPPPCVRHPPPSPHLPSVFPPNDRHHFLPRRGPRTHPGPVRRRTNRRFRMPVLARTSRLPKTPTHPLVNKTSLQVSPDLTGLCLSKSRLPPPLVNPPTSMFRTRLATKCVVPYSEE